MLQLSLSLLGLALLSESLKLKKASELSFVTRTGVGIPSVLLLLLLHHLQNNESMVETYDL